MKKTSLWGSMGAALGMLILILDSKTALSGAREGIRLCLWTVIPSLFPFLVLSNQILGGASGMPGLRRLGKWFSLPEGAEGILIPAFLGGYPVGAQCIGSAYARRALSRETAQNMLAFCSNIGPAFLFGMAGPLFPEKWMVWALWGIQIVSAWMVSLWFSRSQDPVSLKMERNTQPVMAACIQAMGCICGWVVLFRILVSFLDRWVLWSLPEPAAVSLIGLLEISNGCFALADVESLPLRFVLCCGMFSFGGVCVWMQTKSVTQGLSLGNYLLGKAMQGLFSMVLAACILWMPLAAAAILGAHFLIFYGKSRKNSGNPVSVGV